eukprot:COSAG01_NODE_51512_length_354_cov_0.858824_1_plen_27_part_01
MMLCNNFVLLVAFRFVFTVSFSANPFR